jgi:CheY-like chemotaxis protein
MINFPNTPAVITIVVPVFNRQESLTELLGGSIGVNSVYGSGSEFWFTIRAKVYNKKVKEKETIKENAIDIKPKKPFYILVAEDDLANIELISKSLQKAGLKYKIALNGIEVVEYYKKNTDYDIILMDIQMPDKDGYQATKEIREFEKENKLKPVYIIAVTANAVEGEKEKCLAVGMNDYLSKPYKYFQLISIINKCNC